MPHVNIWELHQTHFKNICVRAFYDEILDSILTLESSVKEYKGAIGDLSDSQIREKLLGFDMPYDNLIECFDIIRSAQNTFKRMEAEEAEAKMNRETSSKPHRPPRRIMGDSR